MAISLFKRPAADDTTGRARKVLAAHFKTVRELYDRRLALDDRMQQEAEAIQSVASYRAQVAAAQERIDNLMADGTDPTSERHALEGLRKQRDAKDEAGRVAQLRFNRLQAERQEIVRQQEALNKQTSGLLYDALRELTESLAPELLAAEQAYRAVARKTFAAAMAADEIVENARVGQFVQARNYADLALPRPNLPAYYPVRLTPEAAQNAVRQDYLDVLAEAERLIKSLYDSQ
jgi:hypothetical protein